MKQFRRYEKSSKATITKTSSKVSLPPLPSPPLPTFRPQDRPCTHAFIEEIKSETSGNFERALVALLQSSVEYPFLSSYFFCPFLVVHIFLVLSTLSLIHGRYDAWLIHDAIEGLGTNDEQLIGMHLFIFYNPQIS